MPRPDRTARSVRATMVKVARSICRFENSLLNNEKTVTLSADLCATTCPSDRSYRPTGRDDLWTTQGYGQPHKWSTQMPWWLAVVWWHEDLLDVTESQHSVILTTSDHNDRYRRAQLTTYLLRHGYPSLPTPAVTGKGRHTVSRP